jgi:hypothetical protein
MEFRVSDGDREIRVTFTFMKIKQAQDTPQYEDTDEYNQYPAAGSAL